jgi:MFS transporter, BCD family, chlorophyll transporter
MTPAQPDQAAMPGHMKSTASSAPGRPTIDRPFGWSAIFRLGLVQMCLGAVVVLTTSTLNRVMVVELGLPALLPGLLVALHYAVQMVRPRMGYGSDMLGRCTPWIIGGMAVLATGGVLAALSTAWMTSDVIAGGALAFVAFAMIGLGVSASGTSVLVLLAKRVEDHRRAAAATIVWLMMISGLAVTAGVAGQLLDPYSPERLLTISAVISVVAMSLTVITLFRLEGSASMGSMKRENVGNVGSVDNIGNVNTPNRSTADTKPSFKEALAQVWQESEARKFTVFVFISMLAFSAQDLILEPFAGLVFQYTPGETTSLSGLQHGGVLTGMILVAVACGRFGGRQIGTLRFWTVGGCLASALALLSLVLAGAVGGDYPLKTSVFALGLFNGAFSIAAIASMMRLAGQGRGQREGTRMGLWGAAQAIAFGAGGLLGAAASDLARTFISTPGFAYGLVFFAEAGLFILAAKLAMGIDSASAEPSQKKTTALASWKPKERHEPA